MQPIDNIHTVLLSCLLCVVKLHLSHRSFQLRQLATPGAGVDTGTDTGIAPFSEQSGAGAGADAVGGMKARYGQRLLLQQQPSRQQDSASLIDEILGSGLTPPRKRAVPVGLGFRHMQPPAAAAAAPLVLAALPKLAEPPEAASCHSL